MDVGFIGLGSMGSRIVNLLIDGGHHLTLWARRPESLEPFAGRADTASSPAGVARDSDMVGICVWGAQDVEEVLLGENGVLSGARPGTVVAVHSTISPEACRHLGQAAAAHRTQLIDAAVSVGANLPKLLMMAGGSARGTWSSFVSRPRQPAAGRSPAFATEWARKDVGYALRASKEAGLDADRYVLRLARRGVEVVG